MARLKILSEDDFNKLYQIPKLAGDEEREVIFELDETDREYLATLEDTSTKIDYILQAGYFRIMQYFFQFTFQCNLTVVHRSLNRGESYHQLQAAIIKVSGRKLAGKNEIDLEISIECARLIANCIIYYNTCLLSALYKYYKQANQSEVCQLIIRLSPVAWQHINLIGIYEFYKNYKSINLQAVVQDLICNPEINYSSVS